MTTYLSPPVETDPDALAQLAFNVLQSAFPGWRPADGNVETVTLEGAALIASVVAFLASAALTSVFRSLGPLIGIDPVDATPATAPSTWTLTDSAGHTIPAGTQVGIRDANGNLVAFQTLSDITVPAGQTATGAGAVILVAVTAGAAGSGLGSIGGPVELVTTLSYVATVAQTQVTTGGVDAEADDDYLDRLASELQLLTPRPILPGDFAAIAESVAGIERALAIDMYQPAVNEVETVTINATGGTYTLTFTGQTTAAIAWNANAAAVQAALEALSNIAPGDVAVTGGPGGSAPFTVEFRGVYAGTNVTQMTANAASLTGGSHSVTIATPIGGAAAVTNSERTVTVAVVDENGNAPSGGASAAVQTLLDSEREVNFTVYVIAPTFTQIDVSFTITIADTFDPAAVLAAADAAVAQFLSPAQWGIPSAGDAGSWVDEPTVRYNDLAWVIRNVPGVRHVTVLQLAKHGASLGTADVTLTGPAALPTVGTITGVTA